MKKNTKKFFSKLSTKINQYLSQDITQDPLVALARLGAPVGVRGGIRISQWGVHLKHFIQKEIFLVSTSENIAQPLTNYRIHSTETLVHCDINRVSFLSVKTRENAALLTHLYIAAPLASLLLLAQEERKGKNPTWTDLYFYEIIGLQVFDTNTKSYIGKITALEDLGLNTLVYIQSEKNGKFFSIPLMYPFWDNVDLVNNRVGLSHWQDFVI
ncbi:MAG: Ribosome maturation factor RimM [Turneriella sp.]|nr:Ribosome maturation factor RimM [Turneriella sp.]